MIVPVTSIGSVVVAPCFLSVELGWANASWAISRQPSVTITFSMFASYCFACSARQTSGGSEDGTRATSRISHSPLCVALPRSKMLKQRNPYSPSQRSGEGKQGRAYEMASSRSQELGAMYKSGMHCLHLPTPTV